MSAKKNYEPGCVFHSLALPPFFSNLLNLEELQPALVGIQVTRSYFQSLCIVNKAGNVDAIWAKVYLSRIALAMVRMS